MHEEIALKYPFSSEAKKLLEKKGSASVSQKELAKATQRVFAALDGKRYAEDDALEEASSFALCRLLLALVGSETALKKFAELEGKNAREELFRGDDETLVHIATEFFPSLETGNGKYSVSVLDYLSAGGPRLETEKVEGGRVHFDRNGLALLLQKAVSEKVAKIKVDAKSVPKGIREEAEKIRGELDKHLKTEAPRFKTKLLSTTCLQKLVSGVGEGKRYYASMAISIACAKDGLTKEQASTVLKTFVKNCTGAQPFTEREALASVDWVYKHPGINFSCRTVADQGLLDYKECLQCVGVPRRGKK